MGVIWVLQAAITPKNKLNDTKRKSAQTLYLRDFTRYNQTSLNKLICVQVPFAAPSPSADGAKSGIIYVVSDFYFRCEN